VFNLNEKNIAWLKINLQTRDKHSTETLEILNDGVIIGYDDLGYKFRISKTAPL